MRNRISLIGMFGLIALGCGAEPVGIAEPADEATLAADAEAVAPELAAEAVIDGPALGFDFSGFSAKVRGIDELARHLGGRGCVRAIVPVGVGAASPDAAAREAVGAMVGHARADVLKGKIACAGACDKALVDRVASSDRAFSVVGELAKTVTRKASAGAELTVWFDAAASRAVTLHGVLEDHVFGLAYFADRRDCR